MKVVSVNVGTPVRLGRSRTGIYKTPVPGPVEITALGVEADTVCDRRHHGGLDQALYVYRIEDYEWWTEELGMAVEVLQEFYEIEQTLIPGTPASLRLPIR